MLCVVNRTYSWTIEVGSTTAEYLERSILWSWSILAKGEPLVRSLSSPKIITWFLRPNIFILGQTLFLASSSVLVTYHKNAIYRLCILDLHLDQRLLESTPLFYRIHIFHGMRSGTNNRIKKSVGLGRKKLLPLVQKLCGQRPKRSCFLPRYK